MRYNSLNVLTKKFNAEYRMKDQIIFGNYQGFSFYMQLDDKNFTHTLIVNAKSTKDINVKEGLKEMLLSFENIDDLKYVDGHLLVHYLPFVKEKKTIKAIYESFTKICEFLLTNDFINRCDKTDSVNEVGLYETTINQKVFLSAEYANKWNSIELEKYNQEMNRKVNLPLALIVSLLFTLPGGGLWVLLLKDGNSIAGLFGGLLIMFGAFLGYRFISKKLDKTALVSASIIGAIVVLVSQFFAYNTYAYYFLVNEVNYELSNYFEAINYYIPMMNIHTHSTLLIFSFLLAVISSIIVLTIYIGLFYFKRANAYGAKKVVSDIVVLEEDENENEEAKDEVEDDLEDKEVEEKKEVPYDEEE